jgi:hypothetical protein
VKRATVIGVYIGAMVGAIGCVGLCLWRREGSEAAAWATSAGGWSCAILSELTPTREADGKL